MAIKLDTNHDRYERSLLATLDKMFGHEFTIKVDYIERCYLYPKKLNWFQKLRHKPIVISCYDAPNNLSYYRIRTNKTTTQEGLRIAKVMEETIGGNYLVDEA